MSTKISKDDFIIRSKNIHSNNYDYSLVEYINISPWLNLINIPKEKRQITISILNKKYKVDAFDDTTNTIYEFYGDFWHGNPCDGYNYMKRQLSEKIY